LKLITINILANAPNKKTPQFAGLFL